mmetsp:Transcript_7268/g.10215  ORF Transcript_7268/g.10215 Transcript_7268/m.10215 type:complete len:129 (-) Transcript_7268:284-670(-)
MHVLLLFANVALCISLYNGLIMGVQLLYLTLQVAIVLFERVDSAVHAVLVARRLKSFSHAESDRAVVEGLVVGQDHAVLIAYPDQQKASLCAVNCNLANNLVEYLTEEAFPLRANSILARCLLMQLQV